MNEKLYNLDFYESRENYRQMYAGICKIIDKMFPGIDSVLDVGSGAGYFLSYWENKGCSVFGVEASGCAFPFIPDRIPTVKFNIGSINLETAPFWLDHRFDLVSSIEVGEHLSEEISSHFVGLLCGRAKDLIFFTACYDPKKKGIGHINVKPPGFWIDLFFLYGFAHDKEATILFKKRCKKKKIKPLHVIDNSMFFVRR